MVSVAFPNINCPPSAVQLLSSLGLALSLPALPTSTTRHSTLRPATPLTPRVWRNRDGLVVSVVSLKSLQSFWLQCKCCRIAESCKKKHKIAYGNTDYNTKIILQIVSNLGYIELHAVNLLQFLQHSPGSLYGAFPSAHTVISLQVCTTARSSPVVCRTSEKLNTTVCLYTTSNLRHRRKKCKDRWRTALSSPRL